MRSPRAVMLIAVLGGGLASACHRSLDSSDAQTASKDADANLDAVGRAQWRPPIRLLSALSRLHDDRRMLRAQPLPQHHRHSRLPAGRSGGSTPTAPSRCRTPRRTTAARTRRLATRCSTHAPAASSAVAPNLCININGGPACQVEGPARTQFTSWTSCGWTSSETCLCDGIRACAGRRRRIVFRPRQSASAGLRDRG